MRSATQPYCNTVEYGCVSLRMRLFSQNFGTIKRILPGSSSPSHREGPGVEVDLVLPAVTSPITSSVQLGEPNASASFAILSVAVPVYALIINDLQFIHAFFSSNMYFIVAKPFMAKLWVKAMIKKRFKTIFRFIAFIPVVQ